MAKKDVDNNKKLPYVWATLRVFLGFIFLWAFADKMLGLWFQTCFDKTLMCSSSFIMGGSPTKGWLSTQTEGPFKDFYVSLAGNPFVDWLFMVGLLLIGVALMLGIGVRVAAVSGIVLMAMMWSAVLPPKTNPLIDDHAVYIAVLVGIYLSYNNPVWGFGKYWQSKKLVKKYKWLA